MWVAHLRSKGLVIPRPGVAAKKIELIGYERLRIYFASRRLNAPGRPFAQNTKYSDILALYAFDSKLRSLCFEACGVFEVAFRNSISEALSSNHGGHAHIDVLCYATPKDRKDALGQLTKIYVGSKDARSTHYISKYSSPPIPPIWVVKEFFTFGSSVKFYKHLNNSIKNRVARDFGLPSHVEMTSWVGCLVDLRNICAHHDRLFNRSFQKQPITLNPTGVPSALTNKNKLKAIIECLDYMLKARGIDSDLVVSVGKLISKTPSVTPSEVGY